MRLFLIITYSVVIASFLAGYFTSRKPVEEILAAVCILIGCVLLYFAVNS